jgi:hypothetical protein
MARALRKNSSIRNCSGAATSTFPFSGEPAAFLPTAWATSSPAIGGNSTGANRTVLPSVASSAILRTNSKNCVACTIEYGIAEFSTSF